MFCSKCGKEVIEGQSFCSHCGQNQSPGGIPFVPQTEPDFGLLNSLSTKIKINGFIWLGVAGIQVIMGFVSLISGIYWEEFSEIISAILIFGIAALNVKSAISDLKYSKEVIENPKGVVEKYSPIKNLIVTLVYNIILGGVVGIAGAVYGFILRGFVMKNADELKKF